MNADTWNQLEHTKFMEGLKLFQNDWQKVANHVGTKNKEQTQLHAQEHFKKLQEELSALRSFGQMAGQPGANEPVQTQSNKKPKARLILDRFQLSNRDDGTVLVNATVSLRGDFSAGLRHYILETPKIRLSVLLSVVDPLTNKLTPVPVSELPQFLGLLQEALPSIETKSLSGSFAFILFNPSVAGPQGFADFVCYFKLENHAFDVAPIQSEFIRIPMAIPKGTRPTIARTPSMGSRDAFISQQRMLQEHDLQQLLRNKQNALQQQLRAAQQSQNAADKQRQDQHRRLLAQAQAQAQFDAVAHQKRRLEAQVEAARLAHMQLQQSQYHQQKGSASAQSLLNQQMRSRGLATGMFAQNELLRSASGGSAHESTAAHSAAIQRAIQQQASLAQVKEREAHLDMLRKNVAMQKDQQQKDHLQKLEQIRKASALQAAKRVQEQQRLRAEQAAQAKLQKMRAKMAMVASKEVVSKQPIKPIEKSDLVIKYESKGPLWNKESAEKCRRVGPEELVAVSDIVPVQVEEEGKPFTIAWCTTLVLEGTIPASLKDSATPEGFIPLNVEAINTKDIKVELLDTATPCMNIKTRLGLVIFTLVRDARRKDQAGRQFKLMFRIGSHQKLTVFSPPMSVENRRIIQINVDRSRTVLPISVGNQDSSKAEARIRTGAEGSISLVNDGIKNTSEPNAIPGQSENSTKGVMKRRLSDSKLVLDAIKEGPPPRKRKKLVPIDEEYFAGTEDEIRDMVEDQLDNLNLSPEELCDKLCLPKHSVMTDWFQGLEDDSQDFKMISRAVRYWLKHINDGPPKNINETLPSAEQVRIRIQVSCAMKELGMDLGDIAINSLMKRPYVLYRWMDNIDDDDLLLLEASVVLSTWYMDKVEEASLKIPAEASKPFKSMYPEMIKYLEKHCPNKQDFWVQAAHNAKDTSFYLSMALKQHQTLADSYNSLANAVLALPPRVKPLIGKIPAGDGEGKPEGKKKTGPKKTKLDKKANDDTKEKRELELPKFPQNDRLMKVELSRSRLMRMVETVKRLDKCGVANEKIVEASLVLLQWKYPLTPRRPPGRPKETKGSYKWQGKKHAPSPGVSGGLAYETKEERSIRLKLVKYLKLRGITYDTAAVLMGLPNIFSLRKYLQGKDLSQPKVMDAAISAKDWYEQETLRMKK